MTTEWKIDQAMRAEKAAFDFDPRIQISEGASFDSHIGRRIFANSRGFLGSYRTSSCSLSVVPVAKQDGAHGARLLAHLRPQRGALESPESVGRIAAERAIRRLNARKVATQKVPVIFEPRTARQLLGDIFDAVNGSAIYRHASFLAGKLGEKIASDALTVVDDATIPGLFGTTPFDDEGVASRRTVVIEHGVLKSYLLNTYSARKLNLKTTGNASRGITGNAGIGPGNFFIEAGALPPAEIIASIPSGLYVTELIGGGANTVTGDYSSGAAGLWIENGKLAYPVSEITIAGNHAADAAGDRTGRLGPGIPRLHRRPHDPDSGDDDQWPVSQSAQRHCVQSLICRRVVVLLGAACGATRSTSTATADSDLPLTPEAKAYTRNLQLSDVEMKANENYFQQTVVEIEGKIANTGARPARYGRDLLHLPRPLRPVGAAPAPGDRQRTHGRPETGRDQIVPPALRRPSAELESGHAATGDRRRQVFLMARVLLVDDDAAALDLRKLILEREGHQVSMASDPARARALFAETPPDYRSPGSAAPRSHRRPGADSRVPRRRPGRPHHRPLPDGRSIWKARRKRRW